MFFFFFISLPFMVNKKDFPNNFYTAFFCGIDYFKKE